MKRQFANAVFAEIERGILEEESVVKPAGTATATPSPDEKKPLTLEFGGEQLPDPEEDSSNEAPDEQLAQDSTTLADINAMVPTKIQDLLRTVPSSITFAVSVLLGGSKLAMAMQTMQMNKPMRNFFFNLILLLAAHKEKSEVSSNLSRLFSPAAAKAASDRLSQVYDKLLANKTGDDHLDVTVLQDELMKLIRTMAPMSLEGVDVREKSAQTQEAGKYKTEDEPQ